MKRALGLLAILLSAALAGAAPPTTRVAGSRAAIVSLDGEINEYTRATIIRRIEYARKLGADTIVLKLHTPGGMVGPALDLSRFLKRQDDLRIIAYVDEYSYSAGAMLAVACDEIYMQPGSFIGDCAPIVPGETLAGAERAKAESPLLAEFRDSAQRNGYDELLAQSMVQYGLVVHFITNDAGERRFVNEADYQSLIKEGWKPVAGIRDPVDSDSELLTLNADDAGIVGLSRGQYPTAGAMLDALQLPLIATLEPNAGDRIVEFLNSSLVRGAFGAIFMMALMAAFYAPGHGFPEAIAAAALMLTVGVPYLTGYAQWYEILAIFVGVILLALEIFVIPGFGVTGITGILLILIGLILTFVPKEPSSLPGVLPSLPSTAAAIKQGTLIVVGGMICSLGLWFWLLRYLPRLPYLNKLILTTTSGETASTFAPIPEPAAWPVAGAIGRVVTDLKPGGTAAFHDESLGDSRTANVISEDGFLPAGTSVVIREVRGNRVVVRKAASQA